MTDRVNPSWHTSGDHLETAGAWALGGATDGYVQPGSSPTVMATTASIDETVLNAFAETSSGTSLTVDIDPGEGFVFGAWLARDTTTSVTLSASTANQTVYVGWNTGEVQDGLIIGLSSAFGANDKKIPIWTFDTDGSGVTSVTDDRTLDRVTDAIPDTVDWNRNLQPEGAQTGLAADATGVKYEGEMRQLIDSRLLTDRRTIYIEAATNSSAGDETVTVEIYDDTAAAVVASFTISGGSPRKRSTDISGSLTAGNEVHVRWNVTTASATGGATFDAINARLLIE